MATWEVQSIKNLILYLSLGLDVRVVSLSPVWGSTVGMEPALKVKIKSVHRESLPLPSPVVEFVDGTVTGRKSVLE